ncbi:MAG: acyl-CoA dehydrogenase family protein [Dehalococcoidia bacterium]|nr:acyl-CoA dehydrogenase family protein [Dehalococcoidia bacterium]
MDFKYPPEVEAFREEFRTYLDRIVTPELKAAMARSHDQTPPEVHAFWRQMGADGYLGFGWPKEYGGGGKSVLFLHAFNHEMGYRNLPVPVVTLNTVGPALMRVGTEEQKQEFLPRILRAEIEFAIGYTEPEAGTDLASLKTSAVRDGDEWVINGRKVFTTGAHQADYLWMAVRTDPDAPKHRGISLLIVPLDSEGIEVQPFHTMAGHRTNLTFYDNVRVPASALVGEENRGWYYMTTQLDFERVAISPIPQMERIVNSIKELFKDGLGPDETWTRSALASTIADLNVLQVLDMKTAAIVANGDVPLAEASMLKVLSNEFKLRHLADVVQMLGEPSLLATGSSGGLIDEWGQSYEGQLRGSSVNLFGGGSNDIQRDLMAIHGLGLPR